MKLVSRSFFLISISVIVFFNDAYCIVIITFEKSRERWGINCQIVRIAGCVEQKSDVWGKAVVIYLVMCMCFYGMVRM